MVNSTSSQHRAQLIREMSKDLNKTRNSSGSSRHSLDPTSPQHTVFDFDPDNEAIMSTRQLDNNPQLPHLRASAQKYSRFTRPEPDFAINTSAIGRAFPDFSRGSVSSDDDSLSIEIGRGVKKTSKEARGKLQAGEYSSNAQLSLDGDSMDFSAPMIGNYEVTATPPLRQRQSSKKTEDSAHRALRQDGQVRKPSGLQNEIVEPSPPPAKTRDYGSGESRKASGESRHTLASIHARVRDENERSRISDERPPTLDLTARNTRFSNAKSQHADTNNLVPTKYSSTKGLLNALSPKNKQKQHGASTPNQGTQQSFMLPDLPNISELVSGVYEDGTPVFSRHGKSRASRFVSRSQQNASKRQNYVDVNEIPVPVDEQAIFLSLKLLQDKVDTLERTNAEAENVIHDLQQKNRALENDKIERKRAPRSDSALGMTDSDGGNEFGGGQRKLLIEKNRLESSVRALQSQVDASNRKSSTTETILKNITQERDSAVSQLGVAYFTIEQLKVENEGLKDENSQLKARISQLTSDRESETQKWTVKEQSLLRKLNRRTEAVETMAEKVGVQTADLHIGNDFATHVPDHTENQGPNAEPSIHKDANTMFDLHPEQKITAGVTENRVTRNPDRTVRIIDSEDSDGSVCEAPKVKGKGAVGVEGKSSRGAKNAQDDESSRDLTYLSFLDSEEVAKLRKTLEQERIERKQRLSLNRQSSKTDDNTTQTAPLDAQRQRSQQGFPRKSSMKDLTSRAANAKDAIEPSVHAKGQTENNRRHSETSMLSTRSQQRGVNAENMTSAFIVPDITIRNPGVGAQPIPELTKEAQAVLDQLSNHDGHNCTVCKRDSSKGEKRAHGEASRETINISRPVPVSERIPKFTENEDDATIRPAQAPGLALAIVLKGLDDELSHLKIQLSQYQALYNGHDPALSKRKRKSVYEKIEGLLQAIEVKSDQIYALYDVLEGQKQDAHEISEEEVEITLQSAGIDIGVLHLRGGGENEQDGEKIKETLAERHPWDLESDEESGEDLPWEGIDR